MAPVVKTKGYLTVSIIIVNYNTKDLTLQSVDSVFSWTKGVPFEVIVVDNGSSERGLKEILKRDFPSASYLASPTNVGFARGNNLALPHCSGRYVGVLNSDAFILNDAFSIMVKYLDENERCGVVGPRLESEDGTVQNSVLYSPGVLRTLLDLLVPRALLKHWDSTDVSTRVAAQSPLRVNSGLSGACLLIRRDCLSEAEIFDPGYFFCLEDADLCYGVLKSGREVCYLPQARVLHMGGSSMKKESFQEHVNRRQLYWKSLLLFFEKNKTGLETAILRTLLAIAFGLLWMGRAAWAMLGRDHQAKAKSSYTLRVFQDSLRAMPHRASKKGKGI